MIILIAESKSMGNGQTAVAHDVYESHKPLFEADADRFMDGLRHLSVPKLAATLGIGPKSAAALHGQIYEFPDKSHGYKVILAYTGVVFKALDIASLTPDAIAYAGGRLRIVSSLYGWLAPDSIIKPYRMEFTAKIAADGASLQRFWKKPLTLALINMIKTTGDSEVLNLLPLDASKCIDWKLVKSFARVYVANFRQQVGAETKTPNATRLKELRGLLLRQILQEQIMTGDALRAISSEEFYYDCDSPYPDHLLFITA